MPLLRRCLGDSDAVNRDAARRASDGISKFSGRARLLGLVYADLGVRLGGEGRGGEYAGMSCGVLEGHKESEMARGIKGMMLWEKGDNEGAKRAWSGVAGGWAERFENGGGVEARQQLLARLDEALQGALEGAQEAFESEGDALRQRTCKALCERGAMVAMEGNEREGAKCFQAAVFADPTDDAAASALEMSMQGT